MAPNESVDQLMIEYHSSRLFIGGKWTEPSGRSTISVVNPATEEVVITVPESSGADLTAAIEAARAASADGAWFGAGVDARAAVIERAAELISKQADQIGRMMTDEMGAPLKGTVSGHVPASVATMLELADFARKFPAREIRRGRGPDALVVREPVGVVAAITPWNGPFATAVNKIVAALLMGCPVICKPSPQTPLDVAYLAVALQDAGLPEGLLSILPSGPAVAAELVANPHISGVTFTGSSAVGREIGRVCSERHARVQLELGGKSAAIVLDDADVEKVTSVLRGGIFRNAGQVCTALTRVLVPRARYAEYVDALADMASSIVVGNPLDHATEMGPLATRDQLDRVEGSVRDAVAHGARIAAGGRRPAGFDRGWYYEPTILSNVENTSAAAQEEIFGPVAVVIPHDGAEHAVELANDSKYGLHGAVFTEDVDVALKVAEKVRSGTFSINACVNNPTAPFGGVKDSGVGREHDLEGLATFTELKTINLPKDLASSLSADTMVRAL